MSVSNRILNPESATNTAAAPLERRCVRYLANFSTGQRGAACTEWLLKAGDGVILLRAKGSARPFEYRVGEVRRWGGRKGTEEEKQRTEAKLEAVTAEAERVGAASGGGRG